MLYEKTIDELESFIKNGDWDGLNVTIPYKKEVLQYLDILGETAQRAGSVNTIVRRPDGKLFGDNTDVYGFIKMVERSKLSVEGRKVLVLGSGGASVAVVAALNELKAQPVVISRSGPDNYDNLNKHSDAEIIVNTTPVGMYPQVGYSPIELKQFPKLKGVLDVIYNPARTELLLSAEKLGLITQNGLYMLVAQAQKSAEIFTNTLIPDTTIDYIYDRLNASMQNIVLIGMPGAGKSTIADALCKLTGRKSIDSDVEILKRTGMSPKDLILDRGETAFRKIETEVIEDLGKQSGLIIATGGGVVTIEDNYDFLHQNGAIVWLIRALKDLDDTDRPLSQKKGVVSLYEQREPLYRHFADYIIDNETDAESVAKQILSMISKIPLE